MSHILLSRRLLLSIGLLVLSFSTARAQGGFDIMPVARLGDPVLAPATLASASQPMLSDTGEILFRGDGGLILTSPDGLVVVAAPGDVAPDGRLIAAIGDASVNARGDVAFVASLQPAGYALLLFSEGTITTIAQGTVPLKSPSLNAHGHVAFIKNNKKILLYADGALTQLVGPDDPAPAPGGNVFNFSSVRLNDAGHVVFATTDVGPGNAYPVGVYRIVNGKVKAIAHRGTVAPNGRTFFDAGSPSLNARGDVAFSGTFSNPGGPPDPPVIFVFSEKTLTQIAKYGDVAGEYKLLSVGSPSIDDQGQVAFPARFGSPPLGQAVFVVSAGLLRPLVVPGELTREGDILVWPDAPRFNSWGQLAFVDSVVPERVDGAPPHVRFWRVYRLTGEGISRVAGEGDVVPATPRIVSASTAPVRSMGRPVFVASIFPGLTGVFDIDGTLRARVGDSVPGGGVITSISEVASNTAGAVAFSAALSTGSALFLALQTGTLIEVVRNGAPAPGGGSFSFSSPLLAPSVNSSGDVAFSACVSLPLPPPPGIPPPCTPSGVFLASNGTITPVVRAGDVAPGGAFTFADAPSLNNTGHIAFVGSVSPANRAGLFVTSDENPTKVARAENPAPGGGTFRSFGIPHLNNAGQVAFGASTDNSTGIFLFTTGEGLRPVVRAGDPLPGGGTFRPLGEPSLGASGRVVFASRVAGASDIGAFVFEDGHLELIARPGTPAPDGDTFLSVTDPRVRGNGPILFTGTTASSGSGVFLASRPAP